MRDDERVSDDAGAPLSDQSLLDLLDALVEDRGKVAAARALGVNYRTMMNCYDSRRVSGRMRRALQECHDSAPGGDDALGKDGRAEALIERTAELEEENRELRELVEVQANQLEELERQVASVEDEELQQEEAERVETEDGRKPQPVHRREPGLPGAGVITLEEQPGEDDALGSAAPLVEEWRALRNPAARRTNRVERAEAAVRRWELEVELLRDFHLTMPPEMERLDASRRADHIRWRLEALAEARQELARAKRIRVLRRILTLSLWWR